MDDTNRKKLSKTDLLKVICDQEQEICDLKFKLETLKTQLQDKNIRLEECGSIAAAAVDVSGVFEAAQKAADIYLNSVKEQTEKQKKLLLESETEITAKSKKILSDAKAAAEKMIADAEKQADLKWTDLSNRLEEFYSVHEGLKELLDRSGVDAERLIEK